MAEGTEQAGSSGARPNSIAEKPLHLASMVLEGHPSLSFHEAEDQQGQVCDEDQACDPPIVLHKQGGYGQGTFEIAEPPLRTVLALVELEHSRCVGFLSRQICDQDAESVQDFGLR